MNRTFTNLDRRAARIFRAIQVGTVRPNSDAYGELATLLFAAEEAPAKPVVLARLTLTRANGRRTIVEVHEGATWSAFFHYFSQDGKKRRTKTQIRSAGRTDGGRLNPSLENVASKLAVYQSMSNPVVRSTIRIFRKARYQQLLNARPDELGLVQMQRLPTYSPAHS
jgi:hypothetical protein